MKWLNKNSKTLILGVIFAASLLRLVGLREVPVSLFGDELDVGYHAYSVLKTGRDYSGNYLPLHMQSLAEWRTPVYLYSVVPTVAVYGISPLGVRLPAAIFGILGVWGLYLLVEKLTDNKALGLIASFVLAFSPWHIQYSRAAFEVTQLLAFIIFGLFFFFDTLKQKGKRKGSKLWMSALLLISSPLIYSTAKLFVPFLLLFLIVTWRKELLAVSRRYLFRAVMAAVIVGTITAYATLFSGGGQRFGYIGVFTDPVIEPEVGYSRLIDARMRGEEGEGLSPTIWDRLYHNKFTFIGDRVTDNYLQSFSTNFLFVSGDPNLRHSIEGMGQFYKLELFALLVGIVSFFFVFKNRKVKLLILFWIAAGVFPSAITRNGGNHATRLILILPPLIFLISYGIYYVLDKLKGIKRIVFTVLYLGLFILSFVFYQHNYWVHNPWYAERWWHSGFKESIKIIKDIEGDYERVFITMKDEPAWIFFAGWYEYPPKKWHEGFPFDTKVVDGFGAVSYIDKFHFASVRDEDGGFYALPKYLGDNDLYMAAASEVGTNLINSPEKTPRELKLIKAIAYPSGEPAFYLFEKK